MYSWVVGLEFQLLDPKQRKIDDRGLKLQGYYVSIGKYLELVSDNILG